MAVLEYFYEITPKEPTVEMDVSLTSQIVNVQCESVDIALAYQYNKTDGVFGWFLSVGIGEDTLDAIGEIAGSAVTDQLRSFIVGKSTEFNIEAYIQHSFTLAGVDITLKPSSLSLGRFDGKLLLSGELALL